MQRTPPRHLAPPLRTRAHARQHLLAESVLGLVAIGLLAAVLIGTMLDRPESSAARLPNLLPPAPTTTRSAATVPDPVDSHPAAALDDGRRLGADRADEGAGDDRTPLIAGRSRDDTLLLAGATAFCLALIVAAAVARRDRDPARERAPEPARDR